MSIDIPIKTEERKTGRERGGTESERVREKERESKRGVLLEIVNHSSYPRKGVYEFYTQVVLRIQPIIVHFVCLFVPSPLL